MPYHNVGRGHKKFETPEQLIEAAQDYFNWVDENPLIEDVITFHHGREIHGQAKKLRAYTLAGFCLHSGISVRIYQRWRYDRPDLLEALDWIDGMIQEQKFTAAAAGLLNPMFIARDLGIAEKTENKSEISHSLAGVLEAVKKHEKMLLSEE